VVFDGVVQQRGARHVRVGDPVVRQDPDGHPEQMVTVGLALPPVGRVQPGRQRQRILRPAAIGRGELRDLHEQAFPQPGPAVHGGDRVQRHPSQQPPFGRAQFHVGTGH
jgi:hypothetical protein